MPRRSRSWWVSPTGSTRPPRVMTSVYKTFDNPDNRTHPMRRPISSLLLPLVLACVASQPLSAAPAPKEAQADPAHNPLIWADVPDIAIIRVGKTYYMSSTTMHMSPGLPIMKSTDLVNWEIASYAYETLADTDEFNLKDGKNDYSKGSWASSLRYHNGTFYATTFSL